MAVVTLAPRAAIAPMPSGAMHTHALLGRHLLQALLAAIESEHIYDTNPMYYWEL
jgi:hypothetical protein